MKTYYYTDSKGNRVPVAPVVNKKIKETEKVENKKTPKLKKVLATTALILAVGAGTMTLGKVVVDIVQKQKTDKPIPENPTTSTSAIKDETKEIKPGLRFEPNSKENIVKNAVYLIEEAARAGQKLDAEDAVLACVVANSNELTAGFMGELFGEKAEQTYNYNTLVDAYLRVCMMQLENVGVASDDEIAFNIENIFANEEDYEYLCGIRDLTYSFNNSNDKSEKTAITTKLNEIATDLCTYDVYDKSSAAGILSMLTLDGMRVVNNNTSYQILHDDIRDEMFGNGDYACQNEETFTQNGQVFQTAYSYRVNDIKLDSVKAKLDEAVLEEGKTPMISILIVEVQEKTKDVQISDFDVVEEINKKRNENNVVTYPYESSPGIEKPNYSEKTDDDVVTNVNGEDVIVVPNNPTEPKPTEPKPTEPKPTEPKPTEPKPTEPKPTEPVITPTIKNPEVTTPTEPEIKVEENVTVKPDEPVVDKGNVEQNKQEAEEQVTNDWEKAQADSDQGSKDGIEFGMMGKAKPNFSGKSEYYINAFNATYDFYYQLYLDSLAQQQQFDAEGKTLSK